MGWDKLQVGESRTLKVQARPKWNDSGITVAKSERYRFVATGTWCDASICDGPAGDTRDGFFFRVTEPLRRVPKAKWFALIGTVGQELSTAFIIGESVEKQMESSGTLNFFANDLPLFYGNNSGEITLRVTRAK